MWGHFEGWLCLVNLGTWADGVFLVLAPEKPDVTPENGHCSEAENPELGLQGLVS